MNAIGIWRYLMVLSFGLSVLAQDRPAAETATVEGIVVKQGTSDNLQGAVVTFRPQTGAAKTATSGEDGKFMIAGLTPGRYQVTSTRTGFVKARRASGPANLTLAAGQRLTDVRIQLTPTAVVTGRVLDENGMPKARVAVAVLRPEYQNGSKVIWPCYASQNSRAQTNSDGEFRIFGIEPGEYYLSSNMGTSGCSSWYYPGVTDPADAVLLHIAPGAELGGFEISEKPVPRYSVHFKIVLPPALTSSPPLRQFGIIRLSRNGIAVEESLLTGNASTDISPDGAFTTSGLTPGSYEIFFDNGLGVQIGHIAVAITDRDVDAGTMVIKPGVALSGRIVAPAGVPAGWTLNRAKVVLGPLDLRDRLMTFTLNTLSTANAEGEFMIAFAPNRGSTERPGTIAEGRYQISLTGLVEDQYLASARIGATDVLDSGLLVDGTPPGAIELTVLNGGRVEGIVRNAKDEPVSDSRVVLVPAPAHRGNLNLFKTGFADQSGRFLLRGVAPGDYGLLAWEDVDTGAWENAEFLKDFEGRAKRITVTAGGNLAPDVRVIPGE